MSVLKVILQASKKMQICKCHIVYFEEAAVNALPIIIDIMAQLKTGN